jgi:hypothetical protein
MNLDAINRDPALKHTPWGRVRVERPADRRIAFVKSTHPTTGEQATLGVVDDNKRTVWEAFYGKRQWEALKVIELAEIARLEERARLEAIDRDISRDRKRAIDKHLSRHVDGRDTLLQALKVRGH